MPVCEFIAAQVHLWLSSDSFLEALPGHLMPDAARQARLPLLLKGFEGGAVLR